MRSPQRGHHRRSRRPPHSTQPLGEDLILFRSVDGRPGLVHPRCVHRGSSLLYGRVDDHGIRCCYHGWAFDTEGNCTDQPCEPHNGANRDKFRQPWFPVEERYGLIWAYLGPPEKKPLLPRYFYWLHFFHSGPQFGSRYGEFDSLDFQPWEELGGLEWNVTDTGVAVERTAEIPDGRVLQTITETVLPGVRGVSNPFGDPGPTDSLGFVVPIDDTNFKIFTVLRGRDRSFFERIESMRPPAKPTDDPNRAQRFPGDWEAQGSQGTITLHSEEHLASSDRGVRVLRRLLREQMAVVANGGDPLNVGFQPGDEIVEIKAGQLFR